MINVSTYIQQFKALFHELEQETPWEITQAAALIIAKRIKTLNKDYKIENNVAIHKDAHVEQGAILKGPIIVSEGCFVASNAYLRNGVFLDSKVNIGPGCEVKSSYIFSNSSIAHFNFVGDSILGSYVNLEAGAIIANHFNERSDRMISVVVGGNSMSTDVEKFGALIGDYSKIGANAVLSPGSILMTKTVVKRLELIDQTIAN